MPPSGPSHTNQNMHRQYQNFSDPHPQANNTRNTAHDTSESRSSGTPRDNNPGPSRRQNQDSSSPHPKANNTTNTSQDTSESRNSGISRNNDPGPSSRQNGNSSGPDPKANNTTNTVQDTSGSRSSVISRNNNPGPSSSVPTLANSVNLEYIWFIDPADSKPYESIRVSRGVENNVYGKVPGLDYVWAASVDNWEALKNMYNHTPGNKASIIMAKHVDVGVARKIRLDWRLFKQSMGQ
ncbi:hypothetical protein FIE12Z_664 [Fusarium flagelliforme]|uniref:Uncharacterized protein n=2 Tax=Fusarium flagelliforme TaxID=2675880 RepID=A0A395N4U7_9HYPO|nr:hypothetical protein FIE12Z_664 [Fusarium flagelliforme]